MTSVLQAMTAGIEAQGSAIMARKGKAATNLTPVPGEAVMTVAEAAGLIPKDVPGILMAREGLSEMAGDLRTQAEFLVAVADALDVMAGKPEAVAIDAKKQAAIDVKLKEQEGERRAADRAKAEAGDKRAEKRVIETEAFDERLARQSAEAQAATFAAKDDPADDTVTPGAAEVSVAAGGWVCPTHGAAAIRELTSRGGRKYRACHDCDEFEGAEPA